MYTDDSAGQSDPIAFVLTYRLRSRLLARRQDILQRHLEGGAIGRVHLALDLVSALCIKAALGSLCDPAICRHRLCQLRPSICCCVVLTTHRGLCTRHWARHHR